ncbi:MAG: hypothetical protein K2X54_27185 [Methylobacterium organophilum]|nr:hypothetical protein [Methylobacterium organophilum]
MSSITSHLAADLTLQTFRAADAFSALLTGIEDVRERREDRRQAGVASITELTVCLREARTIEARAVAAARALADENAVLRAQLAAARRTASVMRASARAHA